MAVLLQINKCAECSNMRIQHGFVPARCGITQQRLNFNEESGWGYDILVSCPLPTAEQGEPKPLPTTKVKSSAIATDEQIKPCEYHRCSPGNYGLENYCDHPNAWEW